MRKRCKKNNPLKFFIKSSIIILIFFHIQISAQKDTVYVKKRYSPFRRKREDIRELQIDGNLVHNRGNEHDIGRGISHKSRIIELYLKGYTYDEIMKRTNNPKQRISGIISSGAKG